MITIWIIGIVCAYWAYSRALDYKLKVKAIEAAREMKRLGTGDKNIKEARPDIPQDLIDAWKETNDVTDKR